MASTPEKRPAEKNDTRRKDSRTIWTPRLIEYVKNVNIGWGTKEEDLVWDTWQHDEVGMQNWQYENSKKLEDIHSHILYHGDGEEVVWQHDVWGLQQYTEIPKPRRYMHG